MSALVRLAQACTSVRRAAAAFFQHDLAVRRNEAGVRLVLQPRTPHRLRADAAGSHGDSATSRAQQELALVRTQLTDLLDAAPDTRATMRHLVFVEQALARQGLQALHRLPLDVLRQALEQIEGLVTNWSPVGLANLRSKMAVAIIDREQLDADAEADADADLGASATAAVLDHAATAAGLRNAVPPSQTAAGAAKDDQALLDAYAAVVSMSLPAVGREATAVPHV